MDLKKQEWIWGILFTNGNIKGGKKIYKTNKEKNEKKNVE